MTTGEVEDETTACQNECQQSNEAFQLRAKILNKLEYILREFCRENLRGKE